MGLGKAEDDDDDSWQFSRIGDVGERKFIEKFIDRLKCIPDMSLASTSSGIRGESI